MDEGSPPAVFDARTYGPIAKSKAAQSASHADNIIKQRAARRSRQQQNALENETKN